MRTAPPASIFMTPSAEQIGQILTLNNAAIKRARRSALGTVKECPMKSRPMASSPRPPVATQVVRKVQGGSSVSAIFMEGKFMPHRTDSAATSAMPATGAADVAVGGAAVAIRTDRKSAGEGRSG